MDLNLLILIHYGLLFVKRQNNMFLSSQKSLLASPNITVESNSSNKQK